VDTSRYLDELRPFRRGEIALARKLCEEPLFLPPAAVDVLRYALRLGQLSTLGAEQDDLVERIATFRLRLLQLLAPVLPTDPARLDAVALYELLPRVCGLVEQARGRIFETQLAGEEELDRQLADKRLVLVLGGAAGAGYVFLGALQRLEELRIQPRYLVGCSIGAILAIIRARTRRFDLHGLRDEVRRLRADAVFRPPTAQSRFGLPAALRLDLRRALAPVFARPDGSQLPLGELAIPVDTLATGLGAAALSRPPEEYAELVNGDVSNAAGIAELRGGVLTRVVSALVSLAMSRGVIVPVLFGSDAQTASLPALDAAGFSAAIPGLLHYDLAPGDAGAEAILETVFERDQIVSLVDGALVSMLPGRFAWEAVERGRIGSRHCAIVALDPMVPSLGANAWLAPLQRVIASTSHRDKAFWDLRVEFRRPTSMLEVFPTDATLRRAQRSGEAEFEETAQLLRGLLAPLHPWAQLRERAPASV
jgi:predicted acylesterase/phospholipase RssA